MRQWLHETLTADATLMALLQGGVHAARGFDSVPATKPFLVHRGSTDTPDIMDGNVAVASTRYWWVWVHDDPGDYTRIDDVLDRVRIVLQGARGGSQSGIVVARWIDSSDDLFDDQMGTVCRYDRYTISHT